MSFNVADRFSQHTPSNSRKTQAQKKQEQGLACHSTGNYTVEKEARSWLRAGRSISNISREQCLPGRRAMSPERDGSAAYRLSNYDADKDAQLWAAKGRSLSRAKRRSLGNVSPCREHAYVAPERVSRRLAPTCATSMRSGVPRFRPRPGMTRYDAPAPGAYDPPLPSRHRPEDLTRPSSVFRSKTSESRKKSKMSLAHKGSDDKGTSDTPAPGEYPAVYHTSAASDFGRSSRRSAAFLSPPRSKRSPFQLPLRRSTLQPEDTYTLARDARRWTSGGGSSIGAATAISGRFEVPFSREHANRSPVVGRMQLVEAASQRLFRTSQRLSRSASTDSLPPVRALPRAVPPSRTPQHA